MMLGQPCRVFGWALLLGVGLLSACGGGGGQPPASLGGKVYGLLPGTPLWLEEGGARIAVTNPNYQQGVARLFAIERGYVLGASYTITIVRQPTNQICRITRNASGVLNVSQDDVQIDCYRTVINDTGIRSADPVVNNSPAMAPDAAVGRDAESDRLTKIGAGVFGFDFTRICRSGDVVSEAGACPAGLSFGASNAWACTRDNVTGLVWAVRDLIDFDPSAVAPVSGFCGQSGWRAPKVRELLSLVHAGKPNATDPAIDLTYFPDTPAAAFRADEIYPDGTGSAWIVHFGQRGASTVGASGDPKIQRWVASRNPSPLADTASSDYVRTAAGTGLAVVEMPNELAWLVPTSGVTPVTWSAALAGAADFNRAAIGGYSDWRLPNRAELETLVRRSPSGSGPALDLAVTGSHPADFRQVFWTASPGFGQPDQTAWVIDFRYGDLSLGLKSGLGGVIYVRNKASGPQP